MPEISFSGYRFACYIVMPVAALKLAQSGPPGIDDSFVRVLRMVVQVAAALRAQSGAVRPA